jgi:flagellar hook-associated protein 2
MSSLSSLGSSTAANNATTSNQPPISFQGLVSGLDTSSIITGLLAIDQAQITAVTTKETSVQTEQTAYKQVEANLLTLQGDIGQLNAPTNGVFDAQTATSSNTNVVSAAASSNAVPGVYSLEVNSLAQSQEQASQGFASPTSTITQGTLQFQIGDGAATTITVDSSNDTLQGLAGAINDANTGLTATVVNDGSGTDAYRLLLTAKNTGTENAVTIVNNLGADGGGAIQPVFNSTYIGAASALSGASAGSSTPTANSGAGGYTGASNDAYTFTVVNGGTVGTNNGITLSYTDSAGAHTGTITLNSGDANALQNVAQGLQVQFSAGTLTAGQSFSVKAYVPTVQTAQDASVTLGSGAGALTVTSPTNQINNLIAGVTLQLQGANPGNPVSITVASDTSGAQKAIDSFVTDYNSLMTYIGQQNSYDPTTNTAGPLFGDNSINEIVNQLQSKVQSVVPGANPQMNQLGALGITFDSTGQLQVNDTTLGNVLGGSIPGVTLGDIKNLFGMSASSNNPGVQFIAGTDQTNASATPYSVKITQAATQASITATNALASQTTIDGANDTFTLSLDGQSSTLTLSDGAYSQTALAQMLQSAINNDSDLAGRQISVGVQGNQLTFTSASFGSQSQINIGSGSANTALGLSGTEASQGTDVVGSYVVNGVTEAAQGIGQFLTGDQANANTSGLEVRVTLSPSQVGAGTQSNLTVSRGIASQLDSLMNQLTDPQTGRLTTIDNGFNTELTSLQAQATQLTNAMNAKQQALETEFANMEATLAQLQAASSAISSLSGSATSLSTANAASASKASSSSSSSSGS